MADQFALDEIKNAAEHSNGFPQLTCIERSYFDALISEVERLRTGLLQCATEAGEDVSDGIPTWPDIVEWAVRAVREGREDAEGGYDALSGLYAACRDAELEASREVERLRADVERKDDVIARAMRMCEQHRAAMTLTVLREALSEEQAVSRSRPERGTEGVGLSGETAQSEGSER